MKTDDAKFLTTEAEDGIDYIKPNIEHKLSKQKRQACRDIVQEVKGFGVNQRQILYLVYLLSLELEDGEIMKALTRAVGENRDKIELGEEGSNSSKKPKNKILLLP